MAQPGHPTPAGNTASPPLTRAQLETSIFAITQNHTVVSEMERRMLELPRPGGTMPLLQQSAYAFRALLDRGMRAVVVASGNNRLEQTHGEMSRLWLAGDLDELVRFLLREAEGLAGDIGGGEGEEIRNVFGGADLGGGGGESAESKLASQFMSDNAGRWL